MLKFNTLLQEADLKPRDVFLLRHEDKKRVKSGLYQIWKSRPEDFEAYQSNQKWKNRFHEGSHLAAFVVGQERETLFVGMYDVLKLSRVNEPFDDPLLGPMEAGDRSFHEIKRSDRMRDHVEKLVIEWGLGDRAWRQRAHEQNKDVLEIRRVVKEEPFPRYANFLQRLGDLPNYPSWRRSLQEKGVYLLVFDDGMQYVGSATGEGGFFQRWENYLATGHGGNEVLKRNNLATKKAMVSILEVSGSAETEQEIVNREMFWKKKLGPRAEPLEPA